MTPSPEAALAAPDLIVEPVFEIVQTGEGHLMLFLSSKPGEPDGPLLRVLGPGQGALLRRGPGQMVALTEMPEGALELLSTAPNLFCVEVDDLEVVRTYLVDLTA